MLEVADHREVARAQRGVREQQPHAEDGPAGRREDDRDQDRGGDPARDRAPLAPTYFFDLLAAVIVAELRDNPGIRQLAAAERLGGESVDRTGELDKGQTAKSQHCGAFF